MEKSERHEAIRERARAAIRNLYHNATPSYPRLDDEQAERFQGWFEGAAEYEIEYLQDGGAYGKDYQKTLRADCNAGKYKSETARDFYVRTKMRHRDEEQADCGMLTGFRVLQIAEGNERVRKLMAKHNATSRNNALWERITEYGKLYTYGRGGRTLAPEKLMHGNRGANPTEDYADKLPIADVIELIRIVESFNRYVADWCNSVPEQWADHVKAEQDEERAQRNKERAAKAKETRERKHWAARDVITK